MQIRSYKGIILSHELPVFFPRHIKWLVLPNWNVKRWNSSCFDKALLADPQFSQFSMTVQVYGCKNRLCPRPMLSGLKYQIAQLIFLMLAFQHIDNSIWGGWVTCKLSLKTSSENRLFRQNFVTGLSLHNRYIIRSFWQRMLLIKSFGEAERRIFWCKLKYFAIWNKLTW